MSIITDKLFLNCCAAARQTVLKKLACVAGGISVGELYCFGGGAARRVGTQVNLTSRLRHSLCMAAPPPKESTPGTRIPPATQAKVNFVPYFCTSAGNENGLTNPVLQRCRTSYGTFTAFSGRFVL